MAWGELFLASRQIIFRDKGARCGRAGEQAWVFMPRVRLGNLTKGKETRTVPIAVQPEVVVAVKRTAATNPCFPRLHDNQGDGTCRFTCIRQPTQQNP